MLQEETRTLPNEKGINPIRGLILINSYAINIGALKYIQQILMAIDSNPI